MKELLRRVPEIPVITAGILWGCIGLFIRIINGQGLVSMEVVSIRAGVTAVIMVTILGLFNRKALIIRIKDLWCFLGTAIASIIFSNYCYFKTIETSSMAAAAVLLYTAPAMVLIMSTFFFKERLNGIKIVAIIITFLGCIFVTGINASGLMMPLKTILIGLGAGFGYALYSIFGKFALNRGYSSYTITAYTFMLAFIGSCFFIDTKKVGRVLITDHKALLFACMFGIISTVLPYLAYTLGLEHMDNSKASVLATIEPVTAAVIGLIVFHEKMTWLMLVGIVMVIAGVAIAGIDVEAKKNR